MTFNASFIAPSDPPAISSNALVTSSVHTIYVVNNAIYAQYPLTHSSLGLSPVSHYSDVNFAYSNISSNVSLILYSNDDNQCSTAPTHSKLDENGTFSSSFDIILCVLRGISFGFFDYSKLNVFIPSKQSPKNSHTFGGF